MSIDTDNEKAQALNSITGIIGQKADSFRQRRIRIPPPQAAAEKKLILDLIRDGLDLANTIKPLPSALIVDLNTLNKEFDRY